MKGALTVSHISFLEEEPLKWGNVSLVTKDNFFEEELKGLQLKDYIKYEPIVKK